MMGLFPNPGQDVYLIIPPFFESASITSPLTNKTSTIRNINFDPSYKNIYIQSATLNGKPYTKNWIDHSFFTEGKELVLVLGEKESTWGTQVADLPPSLSEYAFKWNGNGTASGQPLKAGDRRAVLFDESVVPASGDRLDVKTGGNYWAEAAG